MRVADTDARSGFFRRREAPAESTGRVYSFHLSWSRLTLSALVVSLLICRFCAVLSVPEYALLDRWVRLRPPRVPDARIVIVGIQKSESDSYQERKPSDCACLTISRADLAEAIMRLKQAGAAVIGVDLLLQVPCPHGRGTGRGHDEVLARALNAVGDSVLVAGANPTPDKLYFNNPLPEFCGAHAHARLIASPVLYNPHGVIRGVRMIQLGLPSNREKMATKPLELVGRNLSPLSLAMASVYLHQPCELPVAETPARVRCGQLVVPVYPAERLALLEALGRDPEAGSHAMVINWVGPAGSFPTYALTTVLQARPEELRRWFGGKIVLLGNSAERKYTPVSGRALDAKYPLVSQSGENTMSGTEIHANALNTLLQGRYLRLVAKPLIVALVFVVAFLAAAAFQAWRTSAALGLLGGLLLVVNVSAFWAAARDHWLPAVTLMSAAVLSAAVSAVWGYARVRHEAEELASAAELQEIVTETIVHDLKQPLSAIGALASLLRLRQKQAGATPEGLELLERIQQQVDRAIGDVDELLTTHPGHEVALQMQRCDLVSLLRELAEFQSQKSPSHRVAVQAGTEDAWVRGDLRRLTRVFNNLLDNAIKYWPEGGTVRVEIEAGKPWVEVRVIDQGLGISPEQKERIFARFGRAVPEGMTIPGTGLGLFSVYRIVTAHGGTITVDSNVGVGSTFVVRLPVMEAPAPVAQGERGE